MKTPIQWLRFLLGLFYNPKVYQDVAFREQGYGMKRALILLFILMIPSYFLLIEKIKHSYQTEWKAQIEKIPYMHLYQGELFEVNQSKQANDALKEMNIRWLPPRAVPNLSNQKEFPPYFLGSISLYVKMPDYPLFGINIMQNHHYMPLTYTSDYQSDIISGFSIIESVQFIQILAFATITWMMAYSVCALFLFTFLRSFAFVAQKMVALFMQEKIEYAGACRLLSASGIIPLTLVAIWMDMFPYQDYYKYYFLTIYMFNFYAAIRLMSMRSLSRWLSPSA